jgi:subtilisin family serine protease
MLSPGDIILIELHRAGPRFNFQVRNDQKGYIAIEWWPDDFDAIKYATNKGVVVVEAGGNGAENLDDALYSTRPADFPASWTNPFNRANRDSGAIIVGAGAPPLGTHGRSLDIDRSRLDFSNYGSAFDTQGWGREVTTCGYGDLQGGTSNEDAWYTDTFSGTSSASPIVVGAIACVQGVLRAQGKSPMTPAEARNCLRTTGSPQQDALGRPASQRIGNRPNIKQLISRATGTNEEHKPICAIATAAFGTPMAEKINTLRKFRDEELEPHLVGRHLVYLYYDISPPLARIITRSKNMKTFVRLNLKPIVRFIESRNRQEDT